MYLFSQSMSVIAEDKVNSCVFWKNIRQKVLKSTTAILEFLGFSEYFDEIYFKIYKKMHFFSNEPHIFSVIFRDNMNIWCVFIR